MKKFSRDNFPITTFQHEHRRVPLTIPHESNYSENTYTVIVGKNGVGKSRLLSNMVRDYVVTERLSQNESLIEFDSNDIGGGRIIAVSTSPFDKFMLPPKSRTKEYVIKTNYRYVGMRSGGMNSISSISLISSATEGVLERFLKNDSYDRLNDVFHTLGFTPRVRLIFKSIFNSTASTRNIQLSSFENNQTDFDWLMDFNIRLSAKVIDILKEINESEARRIRAAVENLHYHFIDGKSLSVDIDFSHGNEFSVNNEKFHNFEILESFKILLNYDLIRLMDMKLHKVEYGDMSLRRASSGEQCMLVMILGIAGHINDSSLIFIDEPEISLHPKWQEDFMPLLIKTFSQFRKCQFFIATHSPQIVSQLDGNNCFVTSLSNNEIFPSSYFYERSSDFQLAEIFDAPGSRNEYVTRLAFSLLSKLKKTKTVGLKEIQEMKKLVSLREEIDRDDPTYELVESVEEIVNHYASHQ
ncbi:AAA family ATPase [Alteromonas sp. 345S023]|uniref:AAA family ATPase n=1 Tax=Alteromonas profundi TaxID=2696062 RepID=A0A7X5LP06_9ALTE|nr:AAA family ATPase [Alteromonas profundi]NDV92874.1 AAA family ATPase [Alteromonas profundi]